MRRLLFISFIFCSLLTFGQDSAQNNIANPHDSLIVDSLINQAPAVTETFGTERKAAENNLSFFIGLGTFLLFGLLRFLYSKHIGELLAILSKSSLGRLTSQDGMWQNYMPRLFFVFIYFLSGGYIIGRLIQLLSSIEQGPLIFWLWGVGCLFAAYLLKFLATHSVALIFQMTKTVKSFFNHLSVVNQLLGVILLPICGIVMVVPSNYGIILIILGGVVLLISLIFKVLINFGYVRNMPKVRFLYFILYLCIFEFIPLAVFARYVYNLAWI